MGPAPAATPPTELTPHSGSAGDGVMRGRREMVAEAPSPDDDDESPAGLPPPGDGTGFDKLAEEECVPKLKGREGKEKGKVGMGMEGEGKGRKGIFKNL